MNKTTIISLLLLCIVPFMFQYMKKSDKLSNQSLILHLEQYELWKMSYSIKFDHLDNNYRLFIFINNKLKIIEHNKNLRNYEMGLNQFAHLTEDQFVNLYLGMDSQRNKQIHNLMIEQKQQTNIIGNNEILTDVDWQVLGKVSNIKNQGNCDSGYAFSTTSLIQSSLLMQNQNLTLSQQQIIDCAQNYTTMGCNGGSRIGTLKFAKQKGLVTDKQYPFNGLKGQCKKQTGSYFANFTILESNGCNEIKANLYKSPMTVAVNAKNWQLYKAGIFDNCIQSDDVNHDIYLVGVTLTYWRLKNSWGLRWGEYGYIRLNTGNTCGICSRTGYGYII